jgi:hypothetical protein
MTHILTNDIGTPVEYVNTIIDMLNNVMVHLRERRPWTTKKYNKYEKLCYMFSEQVMRDMDYPMRDSFTGEFPFKTRNLPHYSPQSVVNMAEVSVHYILCRLFIDIVLYPN